MEIFLNNKQDKIDLDLEFWEEFALKTLKLVDEPDNAEVSLSFVDNNEIQQLNKDFRNIDKPTDVLSFPFDNSFNLPIRVLGDVVISTEKAKFQSEEYGHSLEREIGFLMIHGILHLLGYDHENEEDEKEMFDLQKKLLGELGL